MPEATTTEPAQSWQSLPMAGTSRAPLEVEAEAAAQGLLARNLPRRHRHCGGVAAAAAPMSPSPEHVTVLTAAGWLHDIGYGTPDTGFHPVDGARWLHTHGWPDLICSLVAWHTSCHYEAALRGLTAALHAWQQPPQDLLDALTWADLHTDPNGQPCSLDSRLSSIYQRYTADHVVHQAIAAAEPELRTTCARAEAARPH